jgi:hypothetical protein
MDDGGRSMIKKTKHILIRDDDISYFTDPEKFQTVHRVLIERQIPLNIAVVPNARADVLDADGRVEGFIGQPHQGKSGFFPVSENRDLVSFLRSHRFIDIAQHGFSHEKTVSGLPEFAAEKSDELELNLHKGSILLEDTFGSRPLFFVPPFDTVSRGVLQMLRSRFNGVCLSRIPRGLLPVSLWAKHWNMKRKARFLLNWDGFQILQHPGLDFSFLKPMDPIWNKGGFLLLAQDVLVLPLHSWKFFKEDRPDKALLERWHGLLKRMILRPDVRFIRFSDLSAIG